MCRPELSVLDTKIDRIVEESSDDGRSEESENGDKKTTEEEGTKRIRTMSEHSNEVPTTSSTLPPNTQVLHPSFLIKE